MDQLAQWLSTINGYVWGIPLLVLLCGTHLFLTIRLRFIQRYLPTAIKLSVSREIGSGDISQFGALTTALAATIGTGNIAGVASAVAAGGPGAVLWMWLTGVFGIATKYGEALLAVKYRVKTKNGMMAGGPMYVLERGLNMKWLAVLFAIFASVAAFGIGNVVQANSIADLLESTYEVPRWATGLVLTVFTAMVVLGGIRYIAQVCEALVPFMAFGYVAGCLVLLVMKWQTIDDTILLIIKSAFNPQAALGGVIGITIKDAVQKGVSRGLFSNESGLGSAPIVAAAAQTRNPVRQALVSSTGTFWDTVVVCLFTGIVVVNSGKWTSGASGAELAGIAFGEFKYIGPIILNFGLLTFVFSTILGWSYYGEKSIEYLLGARFILPYRTLWVAAVMAGSVIHKNMVWDFADIANGLMAVPNLIALLLLSRVIVSETQKYLWNDNLDKSEEEMTATEKLDTVQQ